MRTLLVIGMILCASHVVAQERLPVWTGGIGLDERTMVEKEQENYTVKLVFSGAEGMYLSRVVVAIADAEGQEVVRTTTQGPILLADIEPGRYTVKARAEGTTKTLHITVGKKLSMQHVVFPARD